MPMVDASLVRYLIVGLLNSSLGLLVIYFAMDALRLGVITANVLGYAVGVCVAFVLTQRWTFAHCGPTVPALVKFLLVLGVAYAANLATVLFFAEVLQWNVHLAQALGIVPYTAIGYLGSRFFAFGNGPIRVGPAGELDEPRLGSKG